MAPRASRLGIGVARRLSEIAKTAADFGVVVVVEPTPTDSNLIESCDDAIELMEQVGAKSVGLMFDTQHAYYRNEVPTDYVYRMGKDLRHIHLSEFGRLPPGEAAATSLAWWQPCARSITKDI